ncbi:MAG: ABC transporter permease [Euryarchaeota archaeon]|nr:ABC transporter permease [Euryarchaeota archaeon]
MDSFSLFYLIKQNLKRASFETAIIIFSAAVAVGILFSTTLFVKSIENGLQTGTSVLGADLVVGPKGYETQMQTALVIGEPAIFSMNGSIEQQVAAIPGVKKTSSLLFLESLEAECCTAGSMFLIGFNSKTDFTITSFLKTNLKKPLNKNEIIIGSEVWYNIGDSVKFYNCSFKVVGILKPTGIGLDRAVFMPIETIYENFGLKDVKPVSVVLVQIKSSEKSEQVAEFITSNLSDVSIITADKLRDSVKHQLRSLRQNSLIVGSILWAISLLTICIAFSGIINGRRNEMRSLRAKGASQGLIFKLIVLEAILLTTIGGFLGIIFCTTIAYSFKNLIVASLRVPYLWPTSLYIGSLIVSSLIFAILTGLLAALYPIYGNILEYRDVSSKNN